MRVFVPSDPTRRRWPPWWRITNLKVLLIASIPFGALFAFVLGIVYAFVWKKPPYPEGHYAFAGAIVTARGGYLRITPITQAGEPQVKHFYYSTAYKGSQVRLPLNVFFRITTKEEAAHVANTLMRAQQAYAYAWQNRDAATIQQMDPFHECSMSNNWKGAPGEAASGPHAAIVPPAAANGRWVAAAVLGVIATAVMISTMDPLFADDRKAYDNAVKKMKKEQKAAEKKAAAKTDDDEE